MACYECLEFTVESYSVSSKVAGVNELRFRRRCQSMSKHQFEFTAKAAGSGALYVHARTSCRPQNTLYCQKLGEGEGGGFGWRPKLERGRREREGDVENGEGGVRRRRNLEGRRRKWASDVENGNGGGKDLKVDGANGRATNNHGYATCTRLTPTLDAKCPM
jgi:hypothetical protein